MSPTERLFKKEYAFQLINIAENDLAAAKVLKDHPEIRSESVLFQIEQAIEKSIKAVLCFEGKAVPLTHDIFAILQHFSQNELPPGGYALHDLTPFATIRRYVEGLDIITPEDIQQALDLAEQVFTWATAKVSKELLKNK